MAVATILYNLAHDHQVYEFNFFGITVTTTVTSNPNVISDWIEKTIVDLSAIDRPVVGVGVQWLPYTGTTSAATLQLAVGEYCLIIQLVHCHDVPDILRNFLCGPYIFAGIWNHSDAWRLEQCDHCLEFGEPPLDLRHHVFTIDDDGYQQRLNRESFETIVWECLGWYGVRLERAISMSNWEVPRLSVAQVQQATADAYASCLIGDIYYCYLRASIGYRIVGY